MSRLPHSWAIATIGDVTVDCGQKVPDLTEAFRYIDIASVDRQTKNIVNPQRLLGKDAPSRARKVVRAGDVLVSMTRPNLNAVALVPNSLNGEIASTGFDVLRSNGLEPRWLFYLVRTASFVERMSELVQGALYPAVRSKDVRGHVVPIAPPKEQERIADKLDAVLARVDACRERLDRVPAILKRFRQAVLAAATSGELTNDWRTHQVTQTEPQPDPADAVNEAAGRTYAVPGNPDSAALHTGYDLPEGWHWSCPEEIKEEDRYSLAIGPFGSNLKVADYTTQGTPLVFVRDIRSRSFGRADTKYISNRKAQELAAHTINGGDLLITKMGDPPGDAAIYPLNAPLAVITADCIKLRVNDGVANARFVGYAVESPETRERLQEITVGVAQQKISLERFRRFHLPLAPRPEQDEIVRRVESLFAYTDRLEARYATARGQVERLTPSLLAKAFRGELVPQDPNDEPASVLLERIRAARAAAPAKPKRGRGATLRESREDSVEAVVAAHRS